MAYSSCSNRGLKP
nr:hypothetical chloroplast RF68 [Nicotiana otophora]YP_009336451.1 hypothetical chloroplast RF68 [Nicotiana otophora]ALT14528.1 hypothetical chloroplast RF68 [Nicotiana otophora]ALT14546.1 hypothetical chloroplast RF68 [Nicotiana otophora]